MTTTDVSERRVLVTGGAGYLGTHVTRALLARGYRVCVLDAQLFGSGLGFLKGEPNLEVIRGDVRNVADVSRAARGAFAVVHLAAIVGDAACRVDPDVTWTTNVEATKVIVDACQHYGVPRLVFASSCSVYGASDDLWLNEGSLCRPVSLYAETRLESERICLSAGPQLRVTCLRMATLYGLSKRMRFDLVVNTMAARALREGVVTVFGGDQWRPLVHAADAAEAFAAVLEAADEVATGQIFNVGGNDQNFQVSSLAARISAFFGSAVERRPASLDDARNYRVSFDKIEHLLGFVPRHSIEDACAEIRDLLATRDALDYREDRFQNHHFPYAIDPAVLPSHRPRLRSVDDTEEVRAPEIRVP